MREKKELDLPNLHWIWHAQPLFEYCKKKNQITLRLRKQFIEMIMHLMCVVRFAFYLLTKSVQMCGVNGKKTLFPINLCGYWLKTLPALGSLSFLYSCSNMWYEMISCYSPIVSFGETWLNKGSVQMTFLKGQSIYKTLGGTGQWHSWWEDEGPFNDLIIA